MVLEKAQALRFTTGAPHSSARILEKKSGERETLKTSKKQRLNTFEADRREGACHGPCAEKGSDGGERPCFWRKIIQERRVQAASKITKG